MEFTDEVVKVNQVVVGTSYNVIMVNRDTKDTTNKEEKLQQTEITLVISKSKMKKMRNQELMKNIGEIVIRNN